jgi:serine/threonine protein kinase
VSGIVQLPNVAFGEIRKAGCELGEAAALGPSFFTGRGLQAKGATPAQVSSVVEVVMPSGRNDVIIGHKMVLKLRAGDPQLVGSYRLVGRLGSGGMGKVYLGRSAAGRLVAVKVIRDDLAEDPEFRARFRREIAAARKVSGLFTAPVVDADPDAPVPFLVTAYIAGLSLADAVSRHGPWPAESVLALAAGLAEGLKSIHSVGVVHRDLKPSNVLLVQDGPRVIDFGICRAAEASTVTRAGLAFGSPGFMSPEQAEGGLVGPASDVFSLGAVLAFAAAGEGPFGAGSTAALVYRVVHSPPNLDRVPVPARLLIGRCLAKDAGQRPSPGELLADLDGIGMGPDWLPVPVMRDLPQLAAWPTPTADADRPPDRPATEIDAVSGAPGYETNYPATRTAAKQDPLVIKPDAGRVSPGALGTAGASRLVKTRERRSPSVGMIAALVLLIATGLGAYLLFSHGHGARPALASSHRATAPSTPTPHQPATPSLSHATLVIKLTAIQDCFVLLTRASDGSQIYLGVIPAGSSMTWTERQKVNMRLGNPSGIVLTVNGKQVSLNVSTPTTRTFSPSPS